MTTVVKTQIRGAQTTIIPADDLRDYRRRAIMTPGERAALVDYGLALGAAFQVADDILDAEGDTAALGKKAGKDAGRNKGTLVGALGLDGAKRARDELVVRALDALKPFGARANILAEAARFTAARAH